VPRSQQRREKAWFVSMRTEESKAGWSRRRCRKGESAGETGGSEPYRKGQTVGRGERVATLAKADPETWIVAKTSVRS
jgi:hypothetical protein